MVAFVVGRAVKTAEPVVTVDPGLPLGVHRFQLQVITADGRRSSVDVVDVSVQRLQILEPLQPVLRLVGALCLAMLQSIQLVRL